MNRRLPNFLVIMAFPSGLSTHPSIGTLPAASMSTTIQLLGMTIITQLLYSVSSGQQPHLQSQQADIASGTGSMAKDPSGTIMSHRPASVPVTPWEVVVNSV